MRFSFANLPYCSATKRYQPTPCKRALTQLSIVHLPQPMNILSLQSSVVYGHVGNAAAVFPLQRLGHEVWPLHTVQFSNHTGYGGWRGQLFPAADLAQLVDGIAERGVLGRCHAVLSGYLGNAATGRVVLDAVARVRAANPAALYCCDPVMGDAGRGLFVHPDIPPLLGSEALPAADLLTPNQFELELLAGGPVASLNDALAAAAGLQSRGPSMVAVTSLGPPAVGTGRIGSLLVTATGRWLVDTPRLVFERPLGGAGDVFAALLLGRLLAGESPPAALEKTVNGLYALLARTLAAGETELALIAGQDDLVAPPLRFAARRLD